MPTNGQLYRPTIVFTNGYPDPAATVDDVRDRYWRAWEAANRHWLSSGRRWDEPTAAATRWLNDIREELYDLGVSP